MKKGIALFFIILIAGGIVYAIAFEAHIDLFPYSFRKLHDENGEKINSDYGFGAKAAIRHNFLILFYSGLEGFYNDYKYKVCGEEEHYKTYGGVFQIGTAFPGISKIQLEANVGAGIEVQDMHSEKEWYPVVSGYAGLRFKLNKIVKLTLGADLRKAFKKRSSDFLKLKDPSLSGACGLSIGF